PVASIIVSAFNQERFIARCLESCLAQTLPAEVIVVDGGSHDRTAAIIRERWPQVQLLELPEVAELARQGRSGNARQRNAGRRVARGEFLVFIDGDDELLPDKLARQVPLLQADAGIGLTYGEMEIIDESGASIDRQSRRYGVYAEPITFLQVLTRGRILIHAALFRAAALTEAGGFDEELCSRSDWLAQLRIARCWRLTYSPEPVGCYRVYPAQISSNSGLMKRATAEICEKLLAEGLTQDEAALACLHLGKARYYLREYARAADALRGAHGAHAFIFRLLAMLRVPPALMRRLQGGQ
ncbi:MAG TPA: glycosyltransferase, partial [bacterium]|nr:glycosyltransferase [bacterium]